MRKSRFILMFAVMVLLVLCMSPGIGGAVVNAKCTPTIVLTFDPESPVNAGTSVIMTDNVTISDPGSGNQACGLDVGENVDRGNLKISAVTLGSGGPGRPCSDIGNKYCTVGTSANANNTCTRNLDCVTLDPGNGTCTSVGLDQVASENNTSDGILTYTKDTTGLGGQVLGFVASYQGAGDITNAADVCEDLTVNEEAEPCTGALISIDLASGDGAPAPGGSYFWAFRVTVHACETLFGVTAQGGTNGWASLLNRVATSLVPSDGTTAEIRKANKKTDVILWTIGDMIAGQTETLIVPLSGTIPPKTPDCQVRFLSGAWSALFSTDGINFEKSDYTGRVWITVDSNNDPNDCGL
jgi:hypothetical protein